MTINTLWDSTVRHYCHSVTSYVMEVRHQRSKKCSPDVSAQCQGTLTMLRAAEGPKPGYGAQRAPEKNARTGTQRVPGRSVNLLLNVVIERAGDSGSHVPRAEAPENQKVWVFFGDFPQVPPVLPIPPISDGQEYVRGWRVRNHSRVWTRVWSK
jgi:hypothetical protein